MTTTKLNVRLLRKIQKHILEEPLRFQMITLAIFDRPGQMVSIGHLREQSIPKCGTTQCIAGWANTLTGHQPSGPIAILRAKTQLGITGNSDFVFFDSDWPEPFKSRYRNCKTARGRAKVGADRIDHLITTGE